MHKFSVAFAIVLLFRHTLRLEEPNQMTIQNLNGLLYIYICESAFPAVYGALTAFPDELPLARREISEGMYSSVAYYLGKQTALIPGA